MNDIAISGRAVNPFHRNRTIIFSLFALVLSFLSFHGVLDNLASSMIDELIKRSIKWLLMSTGINAIISVLQTIEFKIPFISSAQIGQILDPLNDGAERFTDALMWGTGSLFLQNILLKITSGAIFKWGYFAIAAMTATSLLLAQSNRVRIAFVTSLGVSHVALAQLQGFLIVTTRASYRRRVRRERFEWPPEDCIPGSPWTGGSLRFGNRLRRTFGYGSTRRLSA